jgi:hypothetical protein
MIAIASSARSAVTGAASTSSPEPGPYWVTFPERSGRSVALRGGDVTLEAADDLFLRQAFFGAPPPTPAVLRVGKAAACWPCMSAGYRPAPAQRRAARL